MTVPAAANGFLSADEIEAAVSGNSLVGYWQNAEVKEHFGADGVSLRQRERGEPVAGRWRVDRARDLLCVSYRRIREAFCFRAQRQRGKLVLFEFESEYPWVTTIVEGNVLAGVGARPVARGSDTAPPGAGRTHLLPDDLFSETYVDSGPVHNGHFMPVGPSEAARHQLAGRLTLPPFAMQGRMELGFGYEWFPGFDLQFFSHGGRLVPVNRDIIMPADRKSRLTLILSPGRVWSEPGDLGLSRASFPFVLGTTAGSAAHNGIASFLYSDKAVSALRIQVVQETARNFFKLNLWGQGRMRYRPGAIADLERHRQDFQAELGRRLPVRPWSELEAKHGAEALAGFDPGARGDNPSASGLIVDGTIYAKPCRSRFGDYPYCAEMRHGGDGLGKTLGAALLLLRLAEKHGEEVFDLRIRDYVEVTARHRGWDRVRFADALNMATGIGDDLGPYRGADQSENFRRSVQAEAASEKLAWIFRDGDAPAGPGERFGHRSADTVVLAAAMDAFLKRQAGAEAGLWATLTDEVLAPIGILRLPMLHSIEAAGRPGIPLLAYGLYPSIDDVAKLADLLHAGGRHRDRQLLHAPTLARVLDFGRPKGLPTGRPGQRYHMSFWFWTFRHPDGACERQIPVISGGGGQLVVLMPNGMTAFRFADNLTYPVEAMARVANRLKPFCS
ncbi:MAG: hypothetical protein QF893_22710 [Alphaproteobacteria bacterium]|nr:hypothetical protein [Alphaproteobacteria bacterium]